MTGCFRLSTMLWCQHSTFSLSNFPFLIPVILEGLTNTIVLSASPLDEHMTQA